MEKQVEYEALRAEILQSMQIVKNYRSLLYTIVVAALAFAFEKNEAILFLVPFFAIIPIYLLSLHQIDSTIRIGAYIYVFIEQETDINWETRLYNYDKLHINEYSTKKLSVDSYQCLSLCCIILSVLKLNYCCIDLNLFFTIFVQIIISALCIYIFKNKKIDYLLVKEKYINEWKEIQRIENET